MMSTPSKRSQKRKQNYSPPPPERRSISSSSSSSSSSASSSSSSSTSSSSPKLCAGGCGYYTVPSTLYCSRGNICNPKQEAQTRAMQLVNIQSQYLSLANVTGRMIEDWLRKLLALPKLPTPFKLEENLLQLGWRLTCDQAKYILLRLGPERHYMYDHVIISKVVDRWNMRVIPSGPACYYFVDIETLMKRASDPILDEEFHARFLNDYLLSLSR